MISMKISNKLFCKQFEIESNFHFRKFIRSVRKSIFNYLNTSLKYTRSFKKMAKVEIKTNVIRIKLSS